jgi:hypothetical protein
LNDMMVQEKIVQVKQQKEQIREVWTKLFTVITMSTGPAAQDQ